MFAARRGKSIGNIGQRFVGALARRDIGMQREQPIRLAGRVANRAAARKHPAPAAVLVTQTMFVFEARRAPVEMGLQSGQSVFAIVRMNAAPPVVDALADLIFGEAEHALPARRKPGIARFQIPFQQAVVGAAYRQRVSSSLSRSSVCDCRNCSPVWESCRS